MKIEKTIPLEEHGTQHIKCGYPRCKYYNEETYYFVEMRYPMPIQGSPCQGLGNPYKHYYGINKPID